MEVNSVSHSPLSDQLTAVPPDTFKKFKKALEEHQQGTAKTVIGTTPATKSDTNAEDNGDLLGRLTKPGGLQGRLTKAQSAFPTPSKSSTVDVPAADVGVPSKKYAYLDFDIREENTNHSVQVSYYDSEKGKWVKLGRKGKGRNADVKTFYGAEENEPYRVPMQDGRPPDLRFENLTTGGLMYGRANSSGRYGFYDDEWKTDNNRNAPDTWFPTRNHKPFPYVKRDKNGPSAKPGQKNFENFTFYDGGAVGNSNVTRPNIDFSVWQEYVRSVGQYVGSSIIWLTNFNPLMDVMPEPISEAEATRALYSLNGNKKLSDKDWDTYQKGGVVSVDINGNWSFNPEKLTERQSAKIVEYILRDESITGDERLATLEKMGMDKNTLGIIDAVFGNHDGQIQGDDISNPTYIDVETGKVIPFENMFARGKKSAKFLSLSDDAWEVIETGTLKPHGKQLDAKGEAHLKQIKSNYAGSSFEALVNGAIEGADNALTQAKIAFESALSAAEAELAEFITDFRAQIRAMADPEHKDHSAYKEFLDIVNKYAAIHPKGEINLAVLLSNNVADFANIPLFGDFFSDVQAVFEIIFDGIGEITPSKLDFMVTPKIFIRAVDLIGDGSSLSNDDKPFEFTLAIAFTARDTMRLRLFDWLVAENFSEVGFQLSSTLSVQSKDKVQAERITVSAIIGDVFQGGLKNPFSRNSAGYVFAAAHAGGSVNLTWFRGNDGKLDAIPDTLTFQVNSAVAAKPFLMLKWPPNSDRPVVSLALAAASIGMGWLFNQPLSKDGLEKVLDPLLPRRPRDGEIPFE